MTCWAFFHPCTDDELEVNTKERLHIQKNDKKFKQFQKNRAENIASRSASLRKVINRSRAFHICFLVSIFISTSLK